MEQDWDALVRRCKRQGSTSSSSRPLIPGPAGAVQAAMYGRRSNPNTLLIPTQEFVRRALEDRSTETDPDFNSNAWLTALQLVESATPLGTITTNVERVESVVAVIKSCTPNGFGDAKVTLKVFARFCPASLTVNLLSHFLSRLH